MTIGSYRVLHWNVAFDGPWSPAAVEKYVEGGFDGLSLVPNPAWAPSDLAFLHELPGLRHFSLRWKLKNDLDAFHVETMENLTLATGSRLPVANMSQPGLDQLAITDRPGIEVRRSWPVLRTLRLGAWRGSDLRMLEGAKELSSVDLEGRRQSGTLAGIETCMSVREFRTVNYSVRDTAPLRGLHQLKELKLLAARPAAPHRLIDLADTRNAPLVKLWISNAAEIRGMDTLTDSSALREVRLIDCHPEDGQTQTLDGLPGRIRVEVVSTTK